MRAVLKARLKRGGSRSRTDPRFVGLLEDANNPLDEGALTVMHI